MKYIKKYLCESFDKFVTINSIINPKCSPKSVEILKKKKT